MKKPKRTTPKGRRTRGRLRLFVAADPPEAARNEAAAWGRHVARSAAGMRPVPAENCHLTLAFIGDREESDLPQIRAAVADAASPGPAFAVPLVSFGAPVWLPPRRPRALALEIHDDRGDLAALQHEIAGSLERSIGWKAKRQFRPHLTVARTGRSFDPDALSLPVGPDLEFEPEAVTLYSSTLLPEGARYETLERVDLPVSGDGSFS